MKKALLVSAIILLWGLTGPHVIVSLDKTTYAHWERPELTVRNIGLMPITFGQGYLIYRWENGSWVKVRQGLVFTLPIYTVLPFSSWKQKIRLVYLPTNQSIGDPRYYPPLPPGRYRVVKEVCGWPRGCQNFSVEFEVTG
ncbi:hypothetical protein E3E23_00075 [Thermococcus sp. CX2]|uniref:immunoglobulin-like domain-containing protein n=1 Tax=Thermococcus sp. CX2 TaxID=163006 RepID=UPI00143B3484|nr:immunoglobulin-like domain-containing protein [Thermococcus sp. CX2]NJE84245.1 hypothetical protein [Thermococcus sp. CX2]